MPLNPKEMMPGEGAKSWLVITATIVLLSGFLLFNAIQAKNREHKQRLAAEQSLSQTQAQLTQVQTDLVDLKKQKEESELALQDQITSLQSNLSDSRKNEDKLKLKVTSLEKDRAQLAATLEQNTANIAKLTKKIDKLQKEKEDLEKSLQNMESNPSPISAYPSTSTAAAGAAADGTEAAPTMLTNSQLPDVVDLGQIVLHGESREPARVEHVNTMYGFIVISAGADDGLRQDTVINVARNNRFIAKAVVKKVRSSVATALLVPEWTREEIRLGDQISINPTEIPGEPTKRRLADFLPR